MAASQIELGITPEKKLSAHDLQELIAAKYQPPYWRVIRELRNATGFDANRTADAIAIGLYRSKGLEMVGFEIKCSRGDWLREMQDATKAETFAQFCDFWYLVCADSSVAKLDEVPAHWGVMVAGGKKLKVTKMPLRREPKPVTPQIRASIIQRVDEDATRAAQEQYDVFRVQTRMQERYNEGLEQGKKQSQERIDQYKKQCEEANSKLQEFADASGINLNTYTPHVQMGMALRRIVDAEAGSKRREFDWILRESEHLYAALAKQAEEMRLSTEGLRALLSAGSGCPGPPEQGAIAPSCPVAGL